MYELVNIPGSTFSSRESERETKFATINEQLLYRAWTSQRLQETEVRSGLEIIARMSARPDDDRPRKTRAFQARIETGNLNLLIIIIRSLSTTEIARSVVSSLQCIPAYIQGLELVRISTTFSIIRFS